MLTVFYPKYGHTFVFRFHPKYSSKLKTGLTETILKKEIPLSLVDALKIFKLMDQQVCISSR